MQQQQLLQKIFSLTGSTKENNSSLNNLLKEHPYFGLAQYYFFQTIEKGSDNETKAAARTNLFFNNSFLLNQRLNDAENVLEFSTDTNNDSLIDQNVDGKSGENDNAEILISDTKELSIEEKTQEDKTEKSAIVDDILFEPLHASDYFASQGIKLSEETLENDKLGKQLKSFTSWLKTMKKVHPDKLQAVPSVMETAVKNQAEKSNIEEEIVTEAMAEAYELQNKHSKAIEIYTKLSLLSPAKSAYFAAKIDSLKK